MSTVSTPDSASRRNLLKGVAVAGVGLAAAGASANSAAAKTPASIHTGKPTGDRLVTKDGTSLYFKDWGTGPAVVFSHGYPLSSDAWEDQMFFLLQNGYRVIAHDRRGFGRSSQPSGGYDYDTFADDLAQLVEALDLREATFVGHSMGGGEVARYVARHGQSRVAKVAFVSSVTPFLLKTATNPNGAPKELFDTFRAAVQANRSQWNLDVTMPYYSFNRPGAHVSEGLRESYWRQGQVTGLLAAYHALGAFSETDFRDDLRKITVPALVVHGSDDQIVPLEISAKLTAGLVPHAKFIVYEGGSHGLLHVDKDRLNADLLAFLRG
ncbi:alpha/beta hydrolase (plasmid) [Rhizobium ruizarguesonis]|jgi:non-heme chloroperoxidase|uniref:Alpha/beta hydrolase n=1 Tax=Rhizobium ruizarguesonis TaxID=2081791 RepID=A0AB38HWR8_9HYPH|nr:alpha/beta hydrolase [Rhizobium ruizarguesonis]MBY5804712.1 alpha/beta hydrolase [Rhizobium leguminosarum]QIO47604.1 alpha/beta hydrolase [Rhizobium leguminosarum bv. trifolii]TCA34925.1 alpha/beta hydrolase [Rhizobium leguminosarum bv. viciae]MBY5845061.1 alpha/beta hydrolase [Rhizobium leguminosarum]NEH82298.1 alpha/beta fold hydrolase [Rhizobium ruizarguesonis]